MTPNNLVWYIGGAAILFLFLTKTKIVQDLLNFPQQKAGYYYY